MKKGKKGRALTQEDKQESVLPIARPSSEVDAPTYQASTLEQLWQTAAASKAKKPKEKQVWLDADLCNKVEMLNLKCGKPVPVKHLFSAIVKIYLDGHKAETSKVKH